MKTTPMFALWQIWADAAQTGMRFWETMAASAVVIDKRMPMIDAGMRNPFTADHVELSGMVTEKAQAFAKAGESLAKDIAAMQGLWMQTVQDMWQAGTSQSLPSARQMAARSDRALRLTDSMIGAGGRALAPIHAKATANAKRLGKR